VPQDRAMAAIHSRTTAAIGSQRQCLPLLV
jgi:hypothetical protein